MVEWPGSEWKGPSTCHFQGFPHFLAFSPQLPKAAERSQEVREEKEKSAGEGKGPGAPGGSLA